MQKTFSILMSIVCIAAFSGCGAKKKELTEVEQLQINNFYETARRENFVRNYAAAESALVSVTKIDQTNFSAWLEIGVLRVRLNKKSAARDAYKKALSTSDAAFEMNAADQNALVTRIQALVYLNRADDAREVVAKVAKDNPKNLAYQGLYKQKAVDAFLADPQTKECMVQ